MLSTVSEYEQIAKNIRSGQYDGHQLLQVNTSMLSMISVIITTHLPSEGNKNKNTSRITLQITVNTELDSVVNK